MDVRSMKHAALLQEWAARIAECRSSGMSVKGWCESQGIAIKKYYYWEKRFITEATPQCSLPATRQSGLLKRVDPDTLAGDDICCGCTPASLAVIMNLPRRVACIRSRSCFLFSLHLRYVFFSPGLHGGDDRVKLLSYFRQAVLYLRRYSVILPAAD